MSLTRLPDADQRVNDQPCLDENHGPPKWSDAEPGSYIWTCPTCGGSCRIEVFAKAWPIAERDAAAPVPRPRPPKSLTSRFYGFLRAVSGALGRSPRWFWRWAWDREFDALVADHDRARAAPGKPVGK